MTQLGFFHLRIRKPHNGRKCQEQGIRCAAVRRNLHQVQLPHMSSASLRSKLAFESETDLPEPRSAYEL